MTMYRVKRGPVIAFAVFIGFLVFYFAPWDVSSSITGKQGRRVDEIYGLLHLVTSDVAETEHVLNDPQLDPTQPVDLSVYSAGSEVNWAKQANHIDEAHPIIVFSKSYCPYSRRAKALLKSYDISPPPKVIEVDLRDDGNVIKQLLTRLTRHSTFPNIIIRGQSIGGSDNLMALHESKQLRSRIEKAGAKARGDGPEVVL